MRQFSIGDRILKEQRRTNRFAVNRTVLYRSRGQSSLGTVCEISLTGLRLKCTSTLEVGAPATLLLLGPGNHSVREVRCRVHWQEHRPNGEREAGLSFLSPMPELIESWVGELLCDLETAGGSLFQRRETVRVPVRLPARAGATRPAQAAESGAETLTFAEIVELSEGGAVVRSRRQWRKNDRVCLRLSLLGRVLELQALVLAVRGVRGTLTGIDYSLQFCGVGPAEAEVLRRMVSTAVRRLKAA